MAARGGPGIPATLPAAYGTELRNQNLGASTFERYSIIRGLLTQDLHPVITERNRTAHGQWVYQLKSHEENVFKAGRAPLPPDYTVSPRPERPH